MELVGYEDDEARSPSSFSSWVVHWNGDKEWDGKENDKILAKEINKKVPISNYFYYYRMYIYNMTYYERLLGLK